MAMYDFGDGNGDVAADQHENGGGWVADTASVAATALVDESSTVYGTANVGGKTLIVNGAEVLGNVVVRDEVTISGAKVQGSVIAYGNAQVLGRGAVLTVEGNVILGMDTVIEGCEHKETVVS